MTVPYTFGNESSPIPLSQLDANFATIPAFANTAGNVSDAAQPAITSVGTLISLSVAGNITSGNLITTGTMSTLSNISAGNLITTGTISADGTVVSAGYATLGNVTANNVNASANILSTGNITGGNILTSGRISSQGNVLAQGTISATGNISTSEYFVGNFLGNITGNLSVGGSNTQVLFNESGNVGAAGGFTYNKDSNTMVVLGVISAQGNVYGGNLTINGTTQLVGVATAPTAANATANNQVASTAFVNNVVNNAIISISAGLGTMATQNSTSVSITGGNISTANISVSTITNSTITAPTIVSGTLNSLLVASIGNNSYGTRTVSTAPPSGGSNGDIWYKI